MTVRIIAISDTHNHHDKLVIPDGDILIHAGDMTGRGTARELKNVTDFLRGLPHQHKILIAGNHDFCFERDREVALQSLNGLIYLQDQEVTVEGLRIYGSPWQPWFYDWAFNLHRGAPIRAKWDRIPLGLDVLITHGPPHGILDQTRLGMNLGCEELKAAVDRVRPRVHIFGHIHEAGGQKIKKGIKFFNVSSCDELYQTLSPPRVIDLET